MYWTSPLVGRAVALELVPTRPLARLARRVRRRAGDQPTHDLLWAEELVRARLLSHYQAQALLNSVHSSVSLGEVTDHLPESPLKIGPYIVQNRIGRSDLGTTYRGRRASDKEVCAIKRIDSRWILHDRDRSRLISELERWRNLGDPRVVVGTPLELEEGGLALISGWAGIESLADWLRAGRPVVPATALSLVYELITLLARVDALGLVYGDLRPSNVIIDRQDTLRLVDCGVRSAIPAAGLRVERDLPPDRYDYVAPEVAAGATAPDAAGDIYAIGCLLYHLITGRPPYFGGSAERKCALHRVGRPVDPQLLGIDTSPKVREILHATLEPDRFRRVGSYNELLNFLSPSSLKTAGRVRAHGRRLPMLRSTIRSTLRSGVATTKSGRWDRWLIVSATVVATAAAILQGSARLSPLLSLRSTTRSRAIATSDGTRAKASNLPTQRATVTALWNATDDLRSAFREAAAHDTITLQSPGPFLLDAIEINKPITLRGAEAVRPLFLGGPGTALRIKSSDVHLENIHFVRVAERLAGQTAGDAAAMVEVFGQRVVIAKCSFQDVSGEPTAALHWQPAGDTSEDAASLVARHTLFRNVDAAIVRAGHGGAQIDLQNCVHLGYGPLIRSTSGLARPFDALDIALSHLTVYGAGTCEHSFPHPLDEAAPLRVTARESLLVPRDRDQPLLAVRYAVQPSTLMPKVSWSGSSTVCPADATVMEVRHGSDASSWRASDIAAWQKYWGTHTTGLLGARLDFAGSAPAVPSDIPSPRLPNQSTLGANIAEICYPLPVTLQQLPLLLERLDPH